MIAPMVGRTVTATIEREGRRIARRSRGSFVVVIRGGAPGRDGAFPERSSPTGPPAIGRSSRWPKKTLTIRTARVQDARLRNLLRIERRYPGRVLTRGLSNQPGSGSILASLACQELTRRYVCPAPGGSGCTPGPPRRMRGPVAI